MKTLQKTTNERDEFRSSIDSKVPQFKSPESPETYTRSLFPKL